MINKALKAVKAAPARIAMPENRLPLTRDYCHSVSERLVFHPETLEEVEFVAGQLQRLGFRYYSQEYPKQLAQATQGCIYLDTDKTIMVSESRRTDGIICSADHFEEFFILDNQMGRGRIPPEEFGARHMIFYPKTLTEARGVLAVLKAAGIEVERKDDEPFQLPVTRAAMQGICVKQGVVRFSPTPEDLRDAEILGAADIGVFARGALSAEQATMVAIFNDMAGRMAQMTERIARLEKEVLPQDVPKQPGTGKLSLRGGRQR